jgi:hypothetical protein
MDLQGERHRYLLDRQHARRGKETPRSVLTLFLMYCPVDEPQRADVIRGSSAGMGLSALLASEQFSLFRRIGGGEIQWIDCSWSYPFLYHVYATNKRKVDLRLTFRSERLCSQCSNFEQNEVRPRDDKLVTLESRISLARPWFHDRGTPSRVQPKHPWLPVTYLIAISMCDMHKLRLLQQLPLRRRFPFNYTVVPYRLHPEKGLLAALG